MKWFLTLSALKRSQLSNTESLDLIVKKSEYVMRMQLNSCISKTVERQVLQVAFRGI